MRNRSKGNIKGGNDKIGKETGLIRYIRKGQRRRPGWDLTGKQNMGQRIQNKVWQTCCVVVFFSSAS